MNRRLDFTPEDAKKILAGIKTETRRRIYRPYTWFKPGDTFAVDSKSFRITAIDRQRLGDITEEEVAREGFVRGGEFVDRWLKLHLSYHPLEEVLVIKFEPAGEQTKAMDRNLEITPSLLA
jgi:hypothetical protein